MPESGFCGRESSKKQKISIFRVVIKRFIFRKNKDSSGGVVSE
jgi:hypothetical protein